MNDKSRIYVLESAYIEKMHEIKHLRNEIEELKNENWRLKERLKRNRIRLPAETVAESLEIKTTKVNYPKSWFKGEEYR